MEFAAATFRQAVNRKKKSSMKWRLLLPGASDLLQGPTTRTLDLVFQTALRSPSNRSKVVVSSYCIADNDIPGKNAFTPSSILFRPAKGARPWGWA